MGWIFGRGLLEHGIITWAGGVLVSLGALEAVVYINTEHFS